MTVRTLIIVGITLSLCISSGCSLPSKHKHSQCESCQTGTSYYYDSTGAGAPNADPNYYPTAPTPIMTPQPGPAPAPLPAVPPPPTGSAERPSRIQGMRDATGDFFRSANNNFRSLFSRDDETLER